MFNISKNFIHIIYFFLSLSYLIFFFGKNSLPTSVDWITQLRFHSEHFWQYNGWKYFFHDKWRFPLGANPLYGNDIGASIVYTDSIPIMAFIIKLFKIILPENIQYYTLWILICLHLQLYFSYKIIFKLTSNRNFAFIGSIFFILIPSIYLRMMNHVALTSHFLIIIGIYLTIFNHEKENIRWAILLSLSSLIHFYFTLMLIPLFLAKIFKKFLINKKLNFFIIDLSITFFPLLLTMFISGYFVINLTDSPGGGYGNYGLNILSIFNSSGLVFRENISFSNFLPSLFLTKTNSEDFNYLGLGGLIFFFLSFYYFINNLNKKFFFDNYHLFLVIIFFTIISISHNIYFGNKLLVSIDLNKYLYAVLGFFRASGRFFWLPIYLILFFCIFQLHKNSKYSFKILFILLILQLIDISAGYKRFGTEKYISKFRNNDLLIDFPVSVSKNFTKLKTSYIKNDYGEQLDLMTFALRNNYHTSDIFTLARFNKKIIYEKRKKNINKILNKEIENNSIYHIYNSGHLQQLLRLFEFDNNINFIRYNGYFFMFKSKFNLDHLTNDLIINKYTFPNLKFNDVKITKDMNNKHLGFGWTYNFYGDQSVITEGNKSYIIYGLEKIKKHKFIIEGYTYQGVKNDLNIKVFVNDIFYKDFNLKDKFNLEIDIADKFLTNKKDVIIEFVINNPKSPLSNFSSPDARELGFYLKNFYIKT